MSLFKLKALNSPWSRTKFKINLINTGRWAAIVLLFIYGIKGAFDLTWLHYVSMIIIYLISQYFIVKLELIADYQMAEILRAEDSGRFRNS